MFLLAASNSGSDVLFGWADQNVPDLFICPGDPGQDTGQTRCETNGSTGPAAPDGSYALPLASFGIPTAPLGLRINASGLSVPLQCAAGVIGGRCSVEATRGCIVDEDCPDAGETCEGAGGTCIGGSNADAPCITAEECPGGVCDFTFEEENAVIMPTPDRALISCRIN